MALDPGMQAATPPAAPAAAPEDSAPEAGGGFTVELKVDAQGKMTVCVEPAAEEAGEESGDEGAPEDDESQPVANIGEALKLIREIVTHGGQMSDVGAGADEMGAGYGAAA